VRVRFLTCDVFTATRFGGNPLAVVPDARGLDAAQMQQVAREFNYSETTFVLPAEAGGDRRVRIFTPTREVPFAGHPNVGTAFVLAMLGELGPLDTPLTVTFEEAAGLVPVAVERRDPLIWCELRAPEPLSLGPELAVDVVAEAVGLAADDLVLATHAPRVASVGLPFVVAQVRDRAALARARPDLAALDRLRSAQLATPDVHLWTRADDPADGVDLCTRMFAPFDGVSEDPATGSANGALAGLLAAVHPEADAELRWRVAQGVEMGRPSLLDVRAERRAGEVTGVWVGGQSVLVAEGTITVSA
jgi:trans-2,3-dihydro-3-hydroxyanthranilate isomerase